MNKQLTGYVALMLFTAFITIPAWTDHANAGEPASLPIVACLESWSVSHYISPEYGMGSHIIASGRLERLNLGCERISRSESKHSNACKRLSADKDFVAITKEARKISVRLAELASLTSDLKEDAIQTQNAEERKERIKKAGIGNSSQKEDGEKTEKKEVKKSGIRVPGPDGKLVDKTELDEEY